MKKLALASAACVALSAAARPRAVCGLPRAEAPTDPKALVDQINAAFTEYKTTNDAAIAAATTETAEVKAKLAAIEADITSCTRALEQAQSDLAAANLGGSPGRSPEATAHSDAFHAWFRRGTEPESMRDLEVSAKLTTQSDSDGGYLVPEEMENTIDRVLGTVSAMRGLSRVISVSTDSYKKLVGMGGASSGWVGEEETRSDTDTPTLREILINVHEVYAQPVATQRSLDDARIDVAQWLADEVSIEFAEAEGEAFISGNGVKRPRGILQYDTVDNGSYSWGNLGFVKTGAAADFATVSASVSPADALISLYYALKQGYRNGASFLTSDAVLGTIRKFKDNNGAYIWAPPTDKAELGTILGKPVVTDDNMPAVGANAFPVAFGNFMRGYLIADRFGIRVLRDNLTSKGNVKFYTTKRVGGGVVNFEAIKLLKVAA
jgi:HK97 family phage major capsid protein